MPMHFMGRQIPCSRHTRPDLPSRVSLRLQVEVRRTGQMNYHRSDEKRQTAPLAPRIWRSQQGGAYADWCEPIALSPLRATGVQLASVNTLLTHNLKRPHSYSMYMHCCRYTTSYDISKDGDESVAIEQLASSPLSCHACTKLVGRR